MRELLRTAPMPLVDSERRVIVLWSPKCASATVYTWFAALCGFADEVRLYPFPHKHRTAVWRLSDRLKKSRRADTSGFHVVKIIRDPYTRAASIFRQALVHGLRGGEDLDFASGASFRQFLAVVASLDMKTADVHCRPQIHPIEEVRKADTVINISRSDLYSGLNALEERQGWPQTDWEALQWLKTLETTGRKPPTLPAKGADAFDTPLKRSEKTRQSPFPAYSDLLTSQARKMIKILYAADFQAYGPYLAPDDRSAAC